MALPLGSQAPDFELSCQTGEPVRLSEVTADQVVVLFFYPRDDTPGCTAESCGFRDEYAVFQQAGAEVIGVSADSVRSHRTFADKHQLGFTILSDPGNVVRRKYKVTDTVPFVLPGRATYVIDREMLIRHHVSSQLNAMRHVTETLRIVQQLAKQR